MLSQTGDKVSNLTARFNDNEGAVKRAADTMGDNLIGDLKELASALSEAALQIGSDSRLNGALRDLVQGISNVVTEFNEFPKADFFDEQKRYWSESFKVVFGNIDDQINEAEKTVAEFQTAWRDLEPVVEDVLGNLPIIAARAMIETQAAFEKALAQINVAWQVLAVEVGGVLDGIRPRVMDLLEYIERTTGAVSATESLIGEFIFRCHAKGCRTCRSGC